MKKAMAAVSLLAVLAVVSLWNIRYLDQFTGQLEEMIHESREKWSQGDPKGASASLEEALTLWFDRESYTHVFIRHSEVNDVTDAFYDVFSAIAGENAESADSQYDRLIAHLESIDTMEHVTVKSVF